jgi:hypothetical protein
VNITEHKPTLSPKQERVLECLVAGRSIKATAAEMKMSRTHIYTWLKLPHFQERYEHMRQEVYSRSIARLSDLVANKVVERLAKLIDSKSETNALEAIEKTTDILLRLVGHIDLAADMAALKEQMGSKFRVVK